MLASLFAAAFTVVALVPVPSTAPPAVRGAPPTIERVQAVKTQPAAVVVQRTHVETVPCTVAEKVVENGVEKTVVVTHFKDCVIMENVNIPLGSDISTTAGKRLTEAEALQRLTVGATVVISSDGRPVDRSHLRGVAPDTLVIVAPAPALRERRR